MQQVSPGLSGSEIRGQPPGRGFAEPVIGPATSGRTRWLNPSYLRFLISDPMMGCQAIGKQKARKSMLMKSFVVAAILSSLAIGTGTAWAEDAAAPSKMSAEKKAITKSCSDQADAKGLHGKERKHFRSECKHHGGKAE